MAGHEVIGLDLSQTRVDKLNSGVSVVDDISDIQIKQMLSAGYVASTDPSAYASAEVIIICVPTPLASGAEPDLRAIQAAAAEISAWAKAGTLVVLESTTYPGTTATELVPRFKKAGFTVGQDLFVAYSPERIDPGNKEFGIANTPKVVGADDPQSLTKAQDFYGTFIEEVVPVSGTAEAELTKLLENTYRHINIGLVNELAIVCRELGIDVWEVIRAAATKPFGFQSFSPGPGVGGHCIPIDPNYLNYRVKHLLNRPFRFVELAQDINSSMPAYVTKRVQDLLNEKGKAVNGSTVLLLGITYKANISDTRESPANVLAQLLSDKGANLSFFDPNVQTWKVDGQPPLQRVEDLYSANQSADITVLLQPFTDGDFESLAESASIFLDTRGATKPHQAAQL